MFLSGYKKGHLGISVEQAIKGEALPVHVHKLVEKDWICRFRPASLDLTLGRVENDTGRGVFFTKLTGRLPLEVAVNKNQAEQNRDSARRPEVRSGTPGQNRAPDERHP
jgi:hypothetical protein